MTDGFRISRRRRASGSLALVVTLVAGVLASAPPADAAFPGANGRIAFQGERTGDIYSMEADGTDLQQLTTDPKFDATPAWSPDGQRIAFSRDWFLWVMQADGSGQTPVGGVYGILPSWSPDGSRIAVTDDEAISIVDSDGTNFTYHVSDDADPTTMDRTASWSPDGTRILFTRRSSGQDDIWVMNTDGSGQVNLTNTPGSGEYGGDWSPDGTRIAYVAGGYGGQDVFVANADGSNAVNVSSSPIEEDWVRWSPDGSRLVVEAFVGGGDVEVFVMDADGTNLTNISNYPDADDRWPTWQLQEVLPAPNDDIDAATAITALPFSDGPWDTSGATTDTSPPDPSPSCDGVAGPSVWYALTLLADTPIEINTRGSNYDTTLSIYTRSKRGVLTSLACNDDYYGLESRLQLTATRGTTYFIMVGAYDGGPGGWLHLTAFEVFGVGLTFTGGTVDATAGVATVTGVVTCNQDAWVDYVSGRLRQRIGRVLLDTWFWVNGFWCTPPGTAWSAPISASNGLYVAGGATLLEVYTSGCSSWTGECDDESIAGPVSIRLRGR